ncbi:unnamed protein product [Paramecium pentaurelia]|uniref:Uncharacterized protein n=1 Tax=Paramecium pentaurelia TaxID=43138 RepID=A0A8S1TZI4_9CILI|nr:unnamed protein product [Paramecium pentaurelia]
MKYQNPNLIKIQGIDQKQTPDKDWIINVLKQLKPDHFFFQKYQQDCKYDMKTFTQKQIKKIKELELLKGRKTNMKRFSQVSKENKQKHNNKKSNQVIKSGRKYGEKDKEHR